MVVTIAPPIRGDEVLHEIRSQLEKIPKALNYELPKLAIAETNVLIDISKDSLPVVIT